MESVADRIATPGDHRVRDRAVASFLLVVLVVASLVFWIGIPAGALWALARATDSATHHFVLGLIGVPLTMALFAPFLIWVNALYLRVTGAFRPPEDEEGFLPRRVRGPLEPILFVSFVVALVALFVWFFVFADTAPRTVI